VGGKNVKTGSVLLLKNVTVLKQCSGEVHVVVTPSNMVSMYWKNQADINIDKFCHLSKDKVFSTAVKFKCKEKTHSRILDELEGVVTDAVDSQTFTKHSQICLQKVSSPTEGHLCTVSHSAAALKGMSHPAFELAIPKTRPIACKVPEPVGQLELHTSQQMMQAPVKSAQTKPVFTFKPILKRAESAIVNAASVLDGHDEESLFGDF